MKILIFGASGRTGLELVKQSLSQNYYVTAFVRNPSKMPIQDDNLRLVNGDVVNYEIVEKAVNGHDAVISALGASSPFKYDQTIVDGMRNIVQAMEARSVSRLIYMSAINVKESRKNAGPLINILASTLLRTESEGHEEREKIIKKSQLLWTCIRPGGLTNGQRKGTYRSGENIKAKGIAGSISRADVAHFMLRQLNDSTFFRKAPIVMY